MVMPLFRPISKESVAVIEPAPAFVIYPIPAHVIVDAEPTETVARPPAIEPEIRPLGALDVPLIAKAPVMVSVMADGARVTPVPTVRDATVGLPVIINIPGLLLLLIVTLP